MVKRVETEGGVGWGRSPGLRIERVFRVEGRGVAATVVAREVDGEVRRWIEFARVELGSGGYPFVFEPRHLDDLMDCVEEVREHYKSQARRRVSMSGDVVPDLMEGESTA